jgi:hypothetical protein
MKAFPSNVKDSGKPHDYFHGMDLRDYFATHAPIDFTDLDCIFGSHWDEFSGKELMTKLAIARYDFADAMMKAREKS